jgi:hypothetical protein
MAAVGIRVSEKTHSITILVAFLKPVAYITTMKRLVLFTLGFLCLMGSLVPLQAQEAGLLTLDSIFSYQLKSLGPVRWEGT